MEARKSRLASKVSTWEVTLREKGGLRRPLAWKGAPVVTLGGDPTAGPARSGGKHGGARFHHRPSPRTDHQPPR